MPPADMSKKTFRRIVALLLLQAAMDASAASWTSSHCGGALERAYAFFSVRPHASTQGDFNGDGDADFAFLLVTNGTPAKAAIGVCLSNEARPLLITSPPESAVISTKPRGTAYLDFDTKRPGVFELDAISVSDGASMGASYILRAGVFVPIIDRD
jgi:hypothetical protein